MTDFISTAAIKELLAECPICAEEFDETGRIPRRMPCCVQSICQPCLETYSKGSQTLSCPLCRHRHHLPGGVKSLPKEPLILRILDQLKIQQGLRVSCTSCSGGSPAVAKCEKCGSICQECINAHQKIHLLKDHTVLTFEEMKSRPVENFSMIHRCAEHDQPQQFYCYTCNKVICAACTVVDHDRAKGHRVVKIDLARQEMAKTTDEMLKKLEEKFNTLRNSLVSKENSLKNIKQSKKDSGEKISEVIENLIEGLTQRKAELLSKVDDLYDQNLKVIEQAVDSTTSLMTRTESSLHYFKTLRSEADKTEALRLMTSSQDSLKGILEESPQDVKFDKIEVRLDQAQVKQISTNIKTLGICVPTGQNHPTGGCPRVKLVYIFLYNLFQFIVCVNIASAFIKYGRDLPSHAAGAVNLLFLGQLVACVEILHPLFGIVNSGVFASLSRVAGRIFTFFMVVEWRDAARQYRAFGEVMFCAVLFWTSEGVIRYFFHLLSTVGVASKSVIWLRYSAWILLCALEVLVDGTIAIWCFSELKASLRYRVFDSAYYLTQFLRVYPFLLLFVGYKRMKTILKQRNEKLSACSLDDKKTR